MIRNLLKKSLQQLGLEVRRTGLYTSNPFWAQKLLCSKPKPIIIDVGAHRGETAKTYRKLFPESRIYCIEPSSESFAALEHMQQTDPLMSSHKIAISDTFGSSLFFENELAVTNSLLPVSEKAAIAWGSKIEHKRTTEVCCTTLDEFAATQKINSIDILKLDIQGSEHRAIMGAKNLLYNQLVDLIFLEVILADTYADQSNPFGMLASLSEFGYTPVGFYNMIYSNFKLIQLDALFQKKNA